MKTTILLALLMVSVSAIAERMENYTASNGKTYTIGDEIRIGRGSGMNGIFVYLNIGGWVAAAGTMNGNQIPPLNGNFSGRTVTVLKIRKLNSGQVIFTVTSKNISNYLLDIDNAIATCEIVDCKKDAIPVTVVNTPSKLDELKKLKELFDSGAITQDEYQTEKDKLLKNNQ